MLTITSQVARLVGNDKRADRFEQKAAAPPGDDRRCRLGGRAGQRTVPNFVLYIRRRSAFAEILARSLQVSLLGSGVENVPVAGAAPAAAVVVEGAPIPIKKGAFSPLSLAPFKLAVIVTFTEKLALSAGVEAAMRSLLSQSISDGMDAAAFGPSGTTGSIMTGAANVTASTATSLETAMRKDLEALIAALNAPSPDVVFAMAPSRALFASSVLPSTFAYSIVASTAIPSTTVIAVDPPALPRC